MRSFFLGIFLAVGVVGNAFADRAYYFRKLDITDGLSQNCVNAIMQDSNGFMWFGTRDGLNRYDGHTFRIFRNNFTSGNNLINNFITSLYEDRTGKIWIGTDMGVCIYHPELEKFERFAHQTADGLEIEKTVTKIGPGRNGEILIAVTGAGLFNFDPDTETLTNYDMAGKPGNVRAFAVQDDGRLWVSFFGRLYYTDGDLNELTLFRTTDEDAAFSYQAVSRILFGSHNRMYLASERFGVYEVNLATHNIRRLVLDSEGSNVFVRDIAWYDDKKMWIGSEAGVYIYDTSDDRCIHLASDMFDPYSISDNAIYSICKDRNGDVWLGSFSGGVNHFSANALRFNKYYPTTGDGSLNGRRIREICGQADGTKIWVGTEDAGLFRFDVKTEKFEHFALSRDFPNIHGMCFDGDDLWVGTFSYGVKIIDTTTGRIKATYNTDNRPYFHYNFIFSIFKASTGYIYLGTGYYLIRFDKRDNSFTRIHELDGNLIYDIGEDSNGNLWVATNFNGVYVHEAKSGTWEHYVHTEQKGSLPINKMLSIFEDSRKDMWVTTQGGGLCRFIPATKSFEGFNSTDGLPNDVVFHIEEDGFGYFWLTTNKGLVKFDPVQREVIKTYTVVDGLLGGQFNYKSGYRDKHNNIYFGTTRGMISFNPDNMEEIHTNDPVFITDFLLFNQPVSVGEKGSPLEKSILFTEKLTLKHNQNTFSLRIVALNYSNPETRKLTYKLDGFDRQWQPESESRSINYSRLPPGRYTLRIKDANDNPAAIEKRLDIEILPPFYLTHAAFLLYFLAACTAGYWIYISLTRRTRRREQEMLDKFDQNKEKELYNSKICFFTNVTHEIRTPLTLIKGPLENILSRDAAADKETVEDLKIMKQNVDRLHELIAQLLDFRQTEKEGLRLHCVRCNVSHIVEEVFGRFVPFARQKGFNLTLDLDDPSFFATIDVEALTKILSNLLNNAIKYGEMYISVRFVTADVASSGFFHIVVENDGESLPEDVMEKIFEPFVRHHTPRNSNTPGTGIGLSLARFLAEQHDGTLNVSADENLIRFILRLPVAQQNVFCVGMADDDRNMDPVDDPLEPGDGRNTILIVEDDVSIQRFLSRLLAKKYKVITTENGLQAIKVLSEQMVDLVVSDIMMPVMDGVELCSSIKGDMHYSHIPVVLLTAKTTMQSKIEGTEAGADSYIEKPFSTEYLLAVVDNLIRNRAALKKAFTQYPMAALSNMTTLSNADEDFLRHIHEAILSNVSNPDLKMEHIAETLYMSRASFYRKIKGLLDLSPSEYLRIERLKEAARLLQKGEYQVSEVCYMVGFNSLSYFSKCFFKQYGVLPKDFS